MALLLPLHLSHVSFLSPIAAAQTPASATPPPDDNSSSSIDAIQNIVVPIGCTIVVALVFVYFLYLAEKRGVCCFRHRRSLSSNQEDNNVNRRDPVAAQNGTRDEKFVTFEQVVAMTENFKFKLGRGGFGSVYYGKTSTGREVAVKRLSSESDQGTLEFQAEVDILLRVHHRNLVSLIGYCSEFKERILIYEYMPLGSLSYHLHGSHGHAGRPLDWETRIRIAIDAANGLKYLHTDCDPRIIHRDVKASNILLDENLTAKFSDFGLSKTLQKPSQTQVTTAVKGTIGYLDPEYANGVQRLTDKSDVYSFGIVLLELLSGCKPIVETSSGPQNISDWSRPLILRDQLNEIVDKSMGDRDNVEALKEFALVALSCVEGRGKARPSMSEVYEKLAAISNTYLKPTQSGIKMLSQPTYVNARELAQVMGIDISSQTSSSKSSLCTKPLLIGDHPLHSSYC